MGFVVAAGLSLLLGVLIKVFAGSAVGRGMQKIEAVFTHVALYASIAHVSYILLKNTEFLFRYEGHLSDILLLYPVFLAVSLLATLILRFTIRSSFATCSAVTFLLFTTYILIKTGSLIGAGITMFYYLYLILLGRFTAGGIARLLRLQFDFALDTLLVSFICGILSNYVCWYLIGQLSLLYAATAFGVVLLVTVAGLSRYGRSLWHEARSSLAATHSVLNKTDHTTAVLLNVTLFCLLLLVALLTIKFPGNSDSSARMYCATVFKFAELHGIAFPPFYQHWPLIYQPLLVEISGLPPYLTGGITALRFFHGTVYFSFIPFIILLCHKYKLPYRTVVIFVLVVVSSSFSFCLAYFDKPSVVAYPAFISLLAICLVALKDMKPWYIVLIGALTALIYNSKLVLVHGAVASIVMLGIYLLFNRPEKSAGNCRQAVFASIGIFVVVCSLHSVQNICLRGNPVHPFAADLFKTSRDYPEELRFTKIPASFFERTMPTDQPSKISTINVDSSRGMYRPYIFDSPDQGGRGYGISKSSVTVVVILMAILLPVILLFRSDRLTVFCAVLAVVSFFIWFGWIGDGWRYSTFFPSIALMGSVLVGQRFLANRYLDFIWRYLVYGLLIFSIPVGLYFTAGLPTTGHLMDYLLNRAEKHESLAPVDHVVTTHLREQSDAKPVLLVADMEVSQYGFFQPNFLYQPIRWRETLFTNMVYLSVIKPTHLLTTGRVGSSILIEHYPFLMEHLVLENEFHVLHKPMVLYRFDEETPWAEYHSEYLQKEAYVPGHIEDIQRILARYRS